MIQSRNIKKLPHIAILMCTYNGEQYLKEQLDSIESQDYKNWTLYINDDGSKDNTLNILKSYQKKWGVKRMYIRQGPQKGFCQNFIQMITDKKIKADFYFLSDQDDIWMTYKLSHTLKKLSKFDPSKPHLYTARTIYVSSNAKHILGYSALFLKKTSLKNAIVQSIGGGNTMAFNSNLKKISEKYPKVDAVSHDWWLYILNELLGGKTFYDAEPTILYRQHSKSLIGSNTGFIAKWRRLRMLLNGTYRLYNTKHFEVFNKMQLVSLTSKANIKLINQFFFLRDQPLRARYRLISDLGVYRQTTDSHLALYLGAILHKL